MSCFNTSFEAPQKARKLLHLPILPVQDTGKDRVALAYIMSLRNMPVAMPRS